MRRIASTTTRHVVAAEARQRLVKHQQRRPSGERAREFHQPQLQARQRAGHRRRLRSSRGRRPRARRRPGRRLRRGLPDCRARRPSRSVARSGAGTRAPSGTCVRGRARTEPPATGRSPSRRRTRRCRPCGRTKPLTRLKAVVLPAPFGPISPWTVPLRDRQIEAVDGRDAAERACEAANLEQRRGRPCVARRSATDAGAAGESPARVGR